MANRAAIYWKFVLCDLNGKAISSLQPIATERQLSFPLNRPARCSFTVPSDNVLVNQTYDGDGLPLLDVGCRTIKAFRKTETSAWVLRFNGIVWDLQDSGDVNAARTRVNCFDSMQMLTRRLVRAADGKIYKTVHFNGGSITGMRGDQIAKAMVDRTIQYAGPCGISTALGVFSEAPKQTASFDQEYVAPALIKLCDTGLLDVSFTPLDREDGILNAFSAMPRRGFDRFSVVISYAAPGKSAYQYDRTRSMDTFANDIRLWGGNTTGPLTHIDETYKDAILAGQASASIATYNRYEDAQVLSDVKRPELVEALAEEEFALRQQPRDLLTVLPLPGQSPTPFTQYFLGDTIRVVASLGRADQPDGPRARSSIGSISTALQRVYGVTVDVDDNGVERVTGLDVSPQGL